MRRRSRLACLLPALSLILCSGEATAHPGTGIVVDRQGRVYFTDLRQIWKIDPNGRLSVASSSYDTHSLAFDPEGNLIHKNGLLAIDPAGNRYFDEVNNHRRDISRIFRETPRGETSLFVGGAWGSVDGKGASARLGSIGGLAVGPDGVLYFTDGARVRKASPAGVVSTIARGISALEALPEYERYGGLANHLMGVAVSSAGDVYVANYGNRQLVRITPRGQVLTVASSESPWSPTGVAFWRGSLFILEYGTSLDRVRVRKISPEGLVRTLATVTRAGP